eukprot:Hpha_TRINITY_DN22485_c0_g1::TRINITY_DN22485_c0_g1_i1::g.95070::m.95070
MAQLKVPRSVDRQSSRMSSRCSSAKQVDHHRLTALTQGLEVPTPGQHCVVPPHPPAGVQSLSTTPQRVIPQRAPLFTPVAKPITIARPSVAPGGAVTTSSVSEMVQSKLSQLSTARPQWRNSWGGGREFGGGTDGGFQEVWEHILRSDELDYKVAQRAERERDYKRHVSQRRAGQLDKMRHKQRDRFTDALQRGEQFAHRRLQRYHEALETDARSEHEQRQRCHGGDAGRDSTMTASQKGRRSRAGSVSSVGSEADLSAVASSDEERRAQRFHESVPRRPQPSVPSSNQDAFLSAEPVCCPGGITRPRPRPRTARVKVPVPPDRWMTVRQ